jgi:hypothetical protein
MGHNKMNKKRILLRKRRDRKEGMRKRAKIILALMIGCDCVLTEECRTVIIADADIRSQQITRRHIWPLLMAV